MTKKYYALPGGFPAKSYKLIFPELSPADSTSKIERDLPLLTEAIEFLEWIERSHPFMQQIALRLYSWVKRVEQQDLRQIANFYFGLPGGAK